MIASTTSSSDSAFQYTSPVNSLKATSPSAQRSTGGPSATLDSRSCSGAMYLSVPTNAPDFVARGMGLVQRPGHLGEDLERLGVRQRALVS
ncbi:hypothetical protein WME85_00740 [Sorangium sp. So ce1153]